jgi:hypothetical protein
MTKIPARARTVKGTPAGAGTPGTVRPARGPRPNRVIAFGNVHEAFDPQKPVNSRAVLLISAGSCC